MGTRTCRWRCRRPPSFLEPLGLGASVPPGRPKIPTRPTTARGSTATATNRTADQQREKSMIAPCARALTSGLCTADVPRAWYARGSGSSTARPPPLRPALRVLWLKARVRTGEGWTPTPPAGRGGQKTSWSSMHKAAVDRGRCALCTLRAPPKTEHQVFCVMF